MRAVDFYFDFISPNAYLAWERRADLAGESSITVASLEIWRGVRPSATRAGGV